MAREPIPYTLEQSEKRKAVTAVKLGAQRDVDVNMSSKMTFKSIIP